MQARIEAALTMMALVTRDQADQRPARSLTSDGGRPLELPISSSDGAQAGARSRPDRRRAATYGVTAESVA